MSFCFFTFLIFKTEISKSQELFVPQIRKATERLDGFGAKQIEIYNAIHTEFNGEKIHLFIRRVKTVKDPEKKVRIYIDKYSSGFIKLESVEITDIYDGLEEKSLKFWPGKPELQLICRNGKLFLFSHVRGEDRKYLLYAHKIDLNAMELGPRKNLIRMDLNNREKSIQIDIQGSSNGEYFVFTILPKDVDYIDLNTKFRVYDSDFKLVFSHEFDGRTFAFSTNRVNVSNDGVICLLGDNQLSRISKDTVEITKLENSFSFGNMFHRLPNKWAAYEINIAKKQLGDSVFYAVYEHDTTKICNRIITFQYDLQNNEIFNYQVSQKAPKANFIHAKEILSDEEGNFYLIGTRKYIVNDLFVNNKNRIASQWYFGNIWVTKIDQEGHVVMSKSIQREHTTGLGHEQQFLTIRKSGKIYVIYRDTKRGVRVEKDKSKGTISMADTGTLNAFAIGSVDAFGRVERKVLEVGIKKSSIFSGVPLRHRFISLEEDSFIFLPNQSDLKNGVYSINRVVLP